MFSVTITPCVAVPGAHSPNFNATRLLKPFRPSHSCLCLRPFFVAKDRIYSSCTVFFFLLQFLSFLFFHSPPSLLSSLFHTLFPIPPPLSSCLPPSTSRHPPLLSEEIDWVIWLGASSARFLARGKERSGGDMTTCRNNNNIHNIGRVSMNGVMEKGK